MEIWILVFISAFGLASGACLDGWIHHGSSCYRLRYDTETWIEAKLICEMAGAQLAEIDDIYENNFIHGLITDSHSVWLGGSDLATETEWKWVGSKTDLSFTNWRPTEPNNSAHDENCLEMDAKGLWNDRPCHFIQKYVCEMSFGWATEACSDYSNGCVYFSEVEININSETEVIG